MRHEEADVLYSHRRHCHCDYCSRFRTRSGIRIKQGRLVSFQYTYPISYTRRLNYTEMRAQFIPSVARILSHVLVALSIPSTCRKRASSVSSCSPCKFEQTLICYLPRRRWYRYRSSWRVLEQRPTTNLHALLPAPYRRHQIYAVYHGQKVDWWRQSPDRCW